MGAFLYCRHNGTGGNTDRPRTVPGYRFKQFTGFAEQYQSTICTTFRESGSTNTMRPFQSKYS